MRISFLLKSPETVAATSAAASWPWPSCTTKSKTLSFRATATTKDVNIHETINDLDHKNNTGITGDKHYYHDEETISCDKPEISIGGLRSSERFFFEPGKSKSILEKAKSDSCRRSKKSLAVMEVDSGDPIFDFRFSMEEVVAAYGLRDWGDLEKLLGRYLSVNKKSNHGYIIGAFMELLRNLDFGGWDFSDGSFSSGGDGSAAVDESCSSSSLTTTTTIIAAQYSPLSFSSSTYSSASPCLSKLQKNESCSSSGV